MLGRYRHTVFCSYTGYFVQAIINNFAPLLFLTFRSTFGFSYRQLSVLILLNFLFQLCVDGLSAVVIHRLGYRRCLVAAHVLAAIEAKVANNKKDKYLEYPEIAEAIKTLEEKFAGEGRVLIRPSGTEPLVRVMIEGKDQKLIQEEAEKLAALIQDRMF